MLNGLIGRRRQPKPIFRTNRDNPIRKARGFSFGDRVALDERSTRSRAVMARRRCRRLATFTWQIQMPSLDLSRSLTACGLALPPDDFITWPTNQATSCGLALACTTLSGLAAMMP